MMLMVVFIPVAITLRLATLAISIRNEKNLLRNGATEYGAATSTILALAHIGFYLAAIAEGVWREEPVSWISWAGVAIYGLAMCALFWVIGTLGRLWTVKLIIARDHTLTTNRLFSLVRHPNYYLNIIPELIGFALALQAFATLIAGLPLYLIILAMRIRQEESVMRRHFADY